MILSIISSEDYEGSNRFRNLFDACPGWQERPRPASVPCGRSLHNLSHVGPLLNWLVKPLNIPKAKRRKD
jgi:hypothetical protein